MIGPGMGNHQVIYDPAFRVRKNRVFRLALGQFGEIGGDKFMDEIKNAGALDHHLPHMRNIKQAAGSAYPFMFFHNPQLVIKGHIITGELSHLGAMLEVGGMKGCFICHAQKSTIAGDLKSSGKKQDYKVSGKKLP